jgi:hypothetical protein
MLSRTIKRATLAGVGYLRPIDDQCTRLESGRIKLCGAPDKRFEASQCVVMTHGLQIGIFRAPRLC